MCVVAVVFKLVCCVPEGPAVVVPVGVAPKGVGARLDRCTWYEHKVVLDVVSMFVLYT